MTVRTGGSPTGSSDPAGAVARAVLYEGYVLWPYRRSAPKNQRRWTFGGVHPRSWSEPEHPDDTWQMDVECLAEDRAPADGGEPGRIQARIRFLQVVERRVAWWKEDELQFVDRVRVGGESWTAWDEAREREVTLPDMPLRDGAEARTPLAVPAATEHEWLTEDGRRRAAVVRSWRGLAGELSATCESVGEDAFRIRLRLVNTTPFAGDDRQDALRSTFASSHLVLTGRNVAFVSLTDPAEPLTDAARACRNQGWWPVLVGPRGSRDTLLASPIILPDYPAIAPESPGDLFDGGEIDELLSLHILALTDEEKEEMRATDPATREILERTTALAEDELLSLHGTFREGRTGDPLSSNLAAEAPDAFWREMGQAAPQELVVDGVLLQPGSRVRLHPSAGGDVMDLALADRVAVVEGIDEDDGGGVHLTVVVEDDPGADLGLARMPGHRFFFRPEEVEPLPVSRILVAGIGNVLLGDDGFGPHVVRTLLQHPSVPGVTVREFGIRGLDLAYALKDYDVVIFVDTLPGEGDPGTLHVIEAELDADGPVGLETHGVDPVRVLSFARTIGPLPDEVYVVGCEPAVIPDPDDPDIVGELSAPVAAAVERAAEQVEALVADLRTNHTRERPAEGAEEE